MRGIKDAMIGISTPAFMAGLCSIDDGGEGGEGGEGAASGGGGLGGAAGLLDDDDGGEGGGAEAKPAAPSGGEGGDPEEHDGSLVDVPEPFKILSADKGDKKLSNQEYAAKRGFKDMDAMVTSLRETERALREGGRIKIPGADASDTDKAAYREAMGVPEAPDKYEVALPTAPGIADNYELDTAFVTPLAAIAFEHNVPGSAFKALAGAMMQLQADSIANEAVTLNNDMDKYFKDLGAGAEGRKAEFKRGAQLMGLDKVAIARIQSGTGAAATLDMISKVGAAAGEDYFAAGDGRAQFGVASAAEAKAQLDALINDPVSAAAIRKGEEPYKSKYNRLTRAQAHYMEIDSRGRR